MDWGRVKLPPKVGQWAQNLPLFMGSMYLAIQGFSKSSC
jgi:hypothetical protein